MTKVREERPLQANHFYDNPEMEEKEDADLSKSIMRFSSSFDITAPSEREKRATELAQRLQERASRKKFRVIAAGTTGFALQAQIPYPVSQFCDLSEEQTTEHLLGDSRYASRSARTRNGKNLRMEVHGAEALRMTRSWHAEIGRCLDEIEALEKMRKQVV